jgi:hypothetical protein
MEMQENGLSIHQNIRILKVHTPSVTKSGDYKRFIPVASSMGVELMERMPRVHYAAFYEVWRYYKTGA